MTYILYGLCIVLTLVSFLKDKEKTKKAVINGIKSFEKIMPQFFYSNSYRYNINYFKTRNNIKAYR